MRVCAKLLFCAGLTILSVWGLNELSLRYGVVKGLALALVLFFVFWAIIVYPGSDPQAIPPSSCNHHPLKYQQVEAGEEIQQGDAVTVRDGKLYKA
ncbi:MAG: hypothetical protein EHM36_14370 [Deltaproteobacteria bacterium]|nr:MAG: hypothetical protein EHM36_14370 [Deltaproteobacteria bacterium]